MRQGTAFQLLVENRKGAATVSLPPPPQGPTLLGSAVNIHPNTIPRLDLQSGGLAVPGRRIAAHVNIDRLPGRVIDTPHTVQQKASA